jgi:enoyl-CoA hydratase/carnithine racemase
MASPNFKRDMKALQRLISQADLALGTITNTDPHPSIARSRELLNAAIQLATDLATVNPAAALGAKGGTKTAERGAEYFKQIAGMRKTKAGGRPKKASG